MSGPGAAWYPDPHDPAGLRWWDGNRWTEHTHARVTSGSRATATAVEDRRPATAIVEDRLPVTAVEDRPPATTTANPHVAPLTASAPGATDTRLPPTADVVTRSRRRWWRLRRAGTVGLALVLAVSGAYGAGLLDRFTASESAREASSPTVKVVEGDGYSFEVPNFWRTSEVAEGSGYDHRYQVLGQSTVAIGSSSAPPAVDPTNAAVRSFLFDTASQAYQAELGDLAPTSTTPYAVAGVDGQRVLFSSTASDGQPFEASLTLLIHGRRILRVTIETHGFLADSEKTMAEFDALLASFRFS